MEKGGDGGRGFGKELHLMFSTVSSGIGATVCTAGRFLLVAPFTKLEEEEEEEAESVAPVREDRQSDLTAKHTRAVVFNLWAAAP